MANNHMNASLARWAERNGISTDDIARAVGMSRRYIGEMLDGATPVRLRFIGKFTLVYGPAAASEAFGMAQEPVAK